MYFHFENNVDRIDCMKAFLAVAQTRSFARAARQLRISPSVITKRIRQLERELGLRLFNRTTHQVALSEFGERYQDDVSKLIAAFDDLHRQAVNKDGVNKDDDLAGSIRVKVPGVLAMHALSKAFAGFQNRHPQTRLDVIVVDRTVNPFEEGFDVAIGVSPMPYDGVVNEPLHPFRRLLVASPDYLARRGRPLRPHDLTDHDCLVIHQHGQFWSFRGPSAPIQVNVNARFTANSVSVLLEGALAGNGIGLIWEPLCRSAIESGRLVPVLEDYPALDSWIAAQIPRNRVHVSRVRALVDVAREALTALGGAPEVRAPLT
ncbi:MAG: LysR family transcriptional regulator [Rhizobium sp.]|nr:LysR family transcriptional regulator [Rhizobium sp.]